MKPCKIWQGYKNPDGYGYINANGKTTYAHRQAWEDEYGPIPKGQFVCHHCDNPSCTEPTHLFLGTPADNTHDMVDKGRAKWSNPGESNANSKLTEPDVLVILERIRSGDTHSAIAKDYNVNSATIWMIATGKNWKYLQTKE